MSLSRRSFVQTLGAGAAGVLTSSFIGARGREHAVWSLLEEPVDAAGLVLLNANENPLGPSKIVMDTIRTYFADGGWKPGRYPSGSGDTRAATEAVAAYYKIKPEHVLMGCGSTQHLRTATQLFTSPTMKLVGTIPTYEETAGYARLIGSPVTGVKLDAEFRIDLDAMAAAAQGAGLVFYCNPNNPTATAVNKQDTQAFIEKVNRTSPQTTILVDEAYFDYATDPNYGTMIPLAVDNPRLIVARTFSKAYGMAGIRAGYAVSHPETIKKMAAWCANGSGNLNILAMGAVGAALGQGPDFLTKERARNTAARDYTVNWFKQRGYKATDSQANFIFVDIKRPAKEFRDACREHGFAVGRDFPPFEKTHARISIGTMEEMTQATAVFEKALSMKSSAAAA